MPRSGLSIKEGNIRLQAAAPAFALFVGDRTEDPAKGVSIMFDSKATAFCFGAYTGDATPVKEGGVNVCIGRVCLGMGRTTALDLVESILDAIALLDDLKEEEEDTNAA